MDGNVHFSTREALVIITSDPLPLDMLKNWFSIPAEEIYPVFCKIV